MHRNRTWLLNPIELRTQRNRILPIEGGDGSTLSLDFTTGILDPRLTFTRGTNATFINSSGRVEWANANMAGPAGTNSDNSFTCYNTGATPNFETVTLVSGPTGEPNTAASFTLTAAGFLDSRFGTTSSGTVINFAIGLTYTVSFYYKALRGSSPIAITSRPVASGSTLESATNVVDAPAGNGFTYRTFRFTATATTYAFAVVYGSGFQAGDVLVYSSFQVEPGTVARSYIKTTGTPYYAPRFDHDPTSIGTPRGLLIEGQATNIMFRSQAINTSPWFNAGTMTVSETGSGSPANDATSNVVTWNNGTGAGSAWLQQNVAVSAGNLVVGTAYTWSVWLKSRGGRRVNVFANLQGVTGNREVRVDFGVSPPTVTSTVATGWTSIQTPTIVEYPNGWYKVTTGGTLPSGATSVNFGFSNSDAVPASGTNGFEVWGYQLEAGTGASSYIPTGASTGTRNVDKMSMTDISTMQWNQAAGTFALHMDVAAETNTSSFPAFMGMYIATPVRVVRFLLNNSSGTNPRIGNDTWTATPTQILSNLITRSTAPTAFKYAVSLSNTGQTLNQVVNAGGVTTTSGTGTMQTPTRLLWHQDPSALDTEYFPIHIRSLKYWPTALPNAQLQSLTT